MPDEVQVYSLHYDKFAFAYGQEGGDEVVRDISLSLPEGHVVLITGPVVLVRQPSVVPPMA